MLSLSPETFCSALPHGKENLRDLANFHRYIYLDCGIRYWPNPVQLVVNQSLASMGHPLAGGRMGTRNYLYIKRQIIPGSICLALPRRIL